MTTNEVLHMNMLKKLCLALAGVVLAIVSAASAMSYGTYYPQEYGQPRIGSYTSFYGGCNQGMYCYLSPPIAQTRYGADYYISNIRSAVYPQYPVSYLPTMQRPYIGYPYGISMTPYTAYKSYGGFGGFSACGAYGC